MGLMISLTLIISLKYLNTVNDIEYKQWDISTCTPGDYTIRMKISDKMYENYKANHSSVPLDELIADELEKKIETLKEVNEDPSNEIKVALMKFGYKNGHLIK